MSIKPLRAISPKPHVIDVPVVGWICGHDSMHGLLVDFQHNPAQSPVPARWTVPLDRPMLERAVLDKQRAVLVFEEGDPARPIVTGLVQPLELRDSPAALAQLPGSPTEAQLDGKRLIFEAADEIVLRCGQASIMLRSNGKVMIKGCYVVSHSSGTNRIRGGSVQIN